MAIRTHNMTRRTVLGAAAALVPGLVTGHAARAQGAAAFRAVAVDIAPLLDHGGGNSARTLGNVLLAQMRTTFADRLGGGGALLTARITNLYFSIYDGNEDFAFGHNDNIEGDGIVSSGGRVLSTTHILTELPPSFSGAYFTQGIDRIRLDSIAHQFAYWLRREMAV